MKRKEVGASLPPATGAAERVLVCSVNQEEEEEVRF
jgi:hypothetical protein